MPTKGFWIHIEPWVHTTHHPAGQGGDRCTSMFQTFSLSTCKPEMIFFWLIMKRDTKTDKHRLHTVCSTHVDVQLPLLRFDFNKLHLIGYLDVACSGGFLSLLGNGFLLG
jgi:hypothetical protein